MKPFLVALLGLAVLAGVAAEASAAASHVVIVSIDGPRQTEFLAEPGTLHAPVLGGLFRGDGSRALTFRNEGVTTTISGHATLLCGAPQNLLNDGTEHPNLPTLFERIRKERGVPASAVWIVGGKDKLGALAYSSHPDYGAAYGASVNTSLRSDTATFSAAVSVLTGLRPQLLVVNLASVDLAAHGGSWSGYLRALTVADSLVGVLWDVIESDPMLSGATDLLVSADHGRHDDAHGGFTSHGDGCGGCRSLFFVAAGPDFRRGALTALPRRQEDLAPTVAYALGLERDLMTGFVMGEILADPPGIGTEAVLPVEPGLLAWPNPFVSAVSVAPAIFRAGEDVVVAGADGRIVARHAVTRWPWQWDGRDDAGRPAPPGVYWIRVRGPEGEVGRVRAVKGP